MDIICIAYVHKTVQNSVTSKQKLSGSKFEIDNKHKPKLNKSQ